MPSRNSKNNPRLVDKMLKVGNLELRRKVINKLVNSGMNITPSMLNLILDLDDPLKRLSIIIKELSFLPSFKGCLSKSILNKISNKEIVNVLKRTLTKDNSFSMEDDSNIYDEKNIFEKDNTQIKMERNSPLNEKQLNIEGSIKMNVKSPVNVSLGESSPEIKMKRESKIKPIGSTKSALFFKPIAKDYPFEYSIIKDPTGKLHTTGSYNDFYELTVDKFNRLQKLMKKRSKSFSASKIKNIFRNSVSQEVSTIGMIKDFRQTKKGNYMINIEDLTGSINVLITKNSKNQDIFKKAKKIVNDQMILVEGTYNPGEKGKKGLIFANDISKIDIPTDYEPNRSTEPLSIALISDTHIGSREFEEKLWKRFVKFLNGKIGNSNVREMAGRVKYIIINGDLVDGIGVYPNQQEDLIISDIYKQFNKASEFISGLPDYIKIFYSSGNHEPVRNAIPRPAVPKKYAESLINIGVKCIGNPAVIKTHDVNTLVFHGDSMIDLNLMIPDLENNTPVKTMREMLICRHLAPIFGSKTQIAPISRDWLVIEKIPDIFHTGHVHIYGKGKYRNVSLVNSGCFQSQTEFMKSFGITPTPGIVPIIELDTLNASKLDFKKLN